MQIILAKFFGGVLLVLFSLLPTVIYYITVYQLGLQKGNLDTGGILGSYIGLFFLGSAFTAIGVFASVISSNSIVSFVVSIFLCGFFYLGFEFIYSFSLFGKIDLLIRALGMNAHYASLSRGVIDTRDVLYFVSLIALFVLLTRLSLQSRKW